MVSDVSLHRYLRICALLIAGVALSSCASGEVDSPTDANDAVDSSEPSDVTDSTSDARDARDTIEPTDDVRDTGAETVQPDTDDRQIIYVRAGARAGNGSESRPYGSIEDALLAVSNAEPTLMRIAEGTYDDYPTIESGLTMEGGYADDWNRDVDGNPTLLAPAGPDADDPDHARVMTIATDEPVVVDGLTVRAPDRDREGASTYAVWADGADLTLRNTRLEGGDAGRGADGDPGRNGAFNNCTPHEGGDGGPAQQIEACSSASAEPGAVGNPPTDGGGRGGDGGAHVCTSTGTCDAHSDDTSLNGADGRIGSVGGHGDDGRAPDDGTGSFDGGIWSLADGAVPTEGERGRGGGGGGAGGDCESTDSNCTDNCALRGGAGGKGGQGGCPGTPGENGEPGGASVLLLALNSTVTLEDVTAVPGQGGRGGDGGAGGDGEEGRSGETGFPSFAGDGGDGGPGGRGGTGGHGAGGCGGPGFGAVLVGSTELQGSLQFESTPQGGSAGQGAVSAQAGCPGEAAERQSY